MAEATIEADEKAGVLMLLEEGDTQKDDIVDLERFGFGVVTERDGNNINVCIFDPKDGVGKDGYWFRRWRPVLKRGAIPVYQCKKGE